MHPTASFCVVPRPPAVRWLGDCPVIQTGVEACQAAKSQSVEDWIRVGWHVLTRALVLGLGISVFEKDMNKLVREALGASFAVETFVWAWNTATGCEPLPSGDAACAWLDGEKDGTTALITSMVVRTGILATGIAFAAHHDKASEVVKKSVAAVTALELSIIAGAMAGKGDGAKMKTASSTGECKSGCRSK